MKERKQGGSKRPSSRPESSGKGKKSDKQPTRPTRAGRPEGESSPSKYGKSLKKRAGAKPDDKPVKHRLSKFSKTSAKPGEDTRKPAGKGKKRTEVSMRDDIRLNRYLATAGICSRREADELIAAGLVEVNGKIITTMGYRVQPGDAVKYSGTLIKGEKKQYVLLNKPKGFITTTDDPKARKTVMDLVAKACSERIYPVGRLDRATTGLLLLTNDGDLAKKLTHPSNGASKIYEVVLDKNLTKAHFAQIIDGVTLEDGLVEVDELSWVDGKARNHIGIRIHIGRNRIVRRLFEHLGYEVTKLDRVYFAGLTKKNLPRGHYRFLTKQEIDNFSMNMYK